MSKERIETEIILSGGQTAGKTINELTAQSVKLNREIKKMEIGSAEYVKATADYSKINDRLKEVKGEVYGVTKAQKDLNNTFMDMVPFNGQLQKFIGTFKNVTTVMKGTTLAQKALNLAIAMSGIGALLILFGSLISYLTTTQAGMDKVTKVTRPLFAIFEKLKGLVQELGENVFKGLGQILNGDIKEGLKTLGNASKDAVNGVAGAIKEGAEAGAELDRLTKQIEISQNNMILSQSRLNRELKDQQVIAKNGSKSDAERAKAGKRSIELLEERTRAENELIDLQIKKMEIEQSLNDTSRTGVGEMNTLIAEKENNIARAAAERVGMQAEANLVEIKGTKDTTAAYLSELKEREKADADYAKAVEKSDKDLVQLRISLIADETDRRQAEILNRFETEIAAFEGTEAQKTEFLLLKQQERDLALSESRKKQTELDNATELKSMQETEELRKLQIEEDFFNFILSEDERELQLYDLKKSALEARLELIREINGAESVEYQRQFTELAKLEKEQTDNRIADVKRYADAKKQLEFMGLDATKDVISSTIDLLGQEEDGRRKNAGALRAFKLAQMKISFFTELQAIWETSNASPTNILFPGSGNLIAGLKSAAAGLRFGKGVQEVMGTKFALGGPVLSGKSHREGGIKFRVRGQVPIHEMEKEEIILTKGVYQNPVLRSLASDINVAGGGRSFAMGGLPTNPLNTQISPNASPSSVVNNITNNTPAEESRELVEEVRGLRQEITTWQRQLEVRISTQKVRKAIDDLKDVEMDASI